MRDKTRLLTQKLTVSAMLIAVAIVVNTYRIPVSIGGATAMTVSFGGPFLKFVGLLFGPLFGGAAGAVVDIIVHFTNPLGAWIWALTLVEFIRGVSIPLLYRSVRKINFSLFSTLYVVLFAAITIWGIVNCIAVFAAPGSAYGQFLLVDIGRPKIEGTISGRAYLISVALCVFGLIGLASHFAAQLLFGKKDRAFFERYLRLLPAIAVPGLVLTIVNTFILRLHGYFTGPPIALVMIPRVIEELVMVLYNTYLLAFFLKVYEYSFGKKVE